jgi:hypothetical protein
MVSGKGHSSGGVQVSADPQAGIMATENRPTALVDVTIAFVFAATSTTSPLGIHYYAIAFQALRLHGSARSLR